MALPTGFPPLPNSGGMAPSLNVYFAGTSTNVFDGNAKFFMELNVPDPFTRTPEALPGTVTSTRNPMGGGPSFANPSQPTVPGPLPQRWCYGIRVQNTGANPLHLSFDGVNVHGLVLPNKEVIYLNRRVAGMAFKSATADSATTFVLEAW